MFAQGDSTSVSLIGGSSIRGNGAPAVIVMEGSNALIESSEVIDTWLAEGEIEGTSGAVECNRANLTMRDSTIHNTTVVSASTTAMRSSSSSSSTSSSLVNILCNECGSDCPSAGFD